MATATTLPALLESLTQSLSSANEATPKLSGIGPTQDGISLLDVKNELLLSYLQNLVFLILLKIRNSRQEETNEDHATSISLQDAAVKKLVELRLYLEKGVRPLEDKLRYQIEKVLRAADDQERHAKAAEAAKQAGDSESGSDSDSASGSDSEEGSDEDEESAPTAKISDLQYRPNLSAFVRPTETVSAADKGKQPDGIYRPPKVAPTVMPTTERRERAERRPLKSATMDEFIADEFSAAPLAEPSIGTTIMQGGRKVKTASERKEEAARRDYEETNFVRLPKESKKERAKKNKVEGRRGRVDFGGEEWKDLGEGVDRINRLTKGRGGGTGTRALLEKSRKRGIDTVDGPRGSGASRVDVGERFQKRLKVLEGGRRDRGKKR
ncbi:Sas10/Utp3/C1D family protein [Pleurostoma richardsiae]|uniref:Sas10/Utp3/C1D family protein n=1 Tax=Pleurostoma richardsiae TaxID=41990 RepID=A0AA38VJY0_9PEZI|nr:Sas10/Utp3/C1D family protein [Pleurostoma richardsiae]